MQTRIPSRCRPRPRAVSGFAWASSRRAYTTYATPCSSSWRTWNVRSSSKSHSPIRSGSRNCVWGPLRPAAGRSPAAVQQSEKECLFSMVPPLGRDRALSNYHRPRKPICPQQSSKLLVCQGESQTNPTNWRFEGWQCQKVSGACRPATGAAIKDLSFSLCPTRRGSSIRAPPARDWWCEPT